MEFIPKTGLTPAKERNIFALLATVILVGIGEHLGRRFVPIYLLALNGGILSIGILGGLDNLLNALYSFPGSYITQRLGHKRALQLFDIMAMTGYLIVIFFHTWGAAIIGLLFFLTWSAISLPATMSLIFATMPSNHRVMGVSLHSFIRHFTIALGTALGGILISRYGEQHGVRVSFMIALCLALASLVLQQKLMKDAAFKERSEHRPWVVWHWMKPALRRLLLSDILVRFCEQIPFAFVVVWCMREWDLTAVQFSWLTAVEMATGMLIYIPVATLADRIGKKPFVVATFLFFAAFPLVLLYCHTFKAMLAAFFIRGLKEFGEPARKAMIMELADPDKESATFGMYYLVRDTIVSLAAFGGAFLWMYSPAANLIVACVCGTAGALYFAVFGKSVTASRKPHPSST